jgi:hypothetical protein
LGEQIFQACSGMDVKPKTFEKAADIDAAPVDRLAGKYQIAPGAFITVKTKRGNMMAQLTGQTFLSLKPTSPTEWKYDAVEATLKFDLPEKGASTKVTLFQNGLEIPANRIEK